MGFNSGLKGLKNDFVYETDTFVSGL